MFEKYDSLKTPPGASHLVFMTQSVARLMMGEMTAVVAGHTAYSILEWRILVALNAFRQISQKQLVDYIGYEQAQVSRNLARLEAAGIVASQPSPTDKRARLFSLSPQGQTHFEEILPAVQQYCDQVDELLTTEETAQLRKIYQRLYQRFSS